MTFHLQTVSNHKLAMSCKNWSETLKTVFLVSLLICNWVQLQGLCLAYDVDYGKSLTSLFIGIFILGSCNLTIAYENQQSASEKPKAQISCAVTAQLISAFVFSTWIVQFLFLLNLKFQCSSLLL